MRDGSGTSAPIDSAAKLQQLLDDNPNTVFTSFTPLSKLLRTGTEPFAMQRIAIRSNQSLDAESVIWCNPTLPSPLYLPHAEAKCGPHLLVKQYRTQGWTATIPVTIGIRVFQARDILNPSFISILTQFIMCPRPT